MATTKRTTKAKTVKTKAKTVKKFSNSTRLTKLGFSASELRGLSPRVKSLTRSDLKKLVEKPHIAPAALNLTFKDLQGLQAVAVNALKEPSTGGGGGGDGGVRCCCCVACCCCCCAVSVTQSSAVEVLHA